MWRAHDGMGWWMVFGTLLWILFWGAIIYLIVTLISRSGSSERPTRPDDPLQIAKRRYASGEITREEFQQLRDDLDSSR